MVSLARAFAALLLLGPWQRAGAAEFVVGDVAFGWDSGVNYAAWARGRAFAVGDVLVFEYVSSQHNVYEVSESTYHSCDTGGGGSGVRVRYTSGYDRVVLADARSYWFICDFPGHCLGGMKLAVNVSGAGSLSPNGSNAASPAGSNAASPAGGGRRSWLAWGLALGVVVSM
ncbi:hypothetical protein SETIT_4G282700v2 [Setaria italica]|uniref:Phytocyanin domain-containing protein n=3 Tax=Setaria TaxID=4554 RepID=A0A368QZ57_SETIT|nr:basic blue protein [Setaria italica]XP_034591895.1 basic blue protein-like [Setaria viridis]RCV23235.1 hypothetical protein SETIT_4G282700v2 [Setaria italica]